MWRDYMEGLQAVRNPTLNLRAGNNFFDGLKKILPGDQMSNLDVQLGTILGKGTAHC